MVSIAGELAWGEGVVFQLSAGSDACKRIRPRLHATVIACVTVSDIVLSQKSRLSGTPLALMVSRG
jgi:hypothetical protein